MQQDFLRINKSIYCSIVTKDSGSILRMKYETMSPSRTMPSPMCNHMIYVAKDTKHTSSVATALQETQVNIGWYRSLVIMHNDMSLQYVIYWKAGHAYIVWSCLHRMVMLTSDSHAYFAFRLLGTSSRNSSLSHQPCIQSPICSTCSLFLAHRLRRSNVFKFYCLKQNHVESDPVSCSWYFGGLFLAGYT